MAGNRRRGRTTLRKDISEGKQQRAVENFTSALTGVIQAIEEVTDDLGSETTNLLKKSMKAMSEADMQPREIANNIISQLITELNKQGKKININTLITAFEKMSDLSPELKNILKNLLEAQDSLYIGMKSMAANLAEELIKPFDGMVKWIEKIPGGKLLYDMFGFDKIRKEIKRSITDKLEASIKNNTASFKTLKEVGISTFKSIGSAVKVLFSNPLLLAIALIIGALVIAYKQWNKTADAARKLTEETGLTGDQAWELSRAVQDISVQYRSLGLDMEAMQKAMAGVVNEFQTTAVLTDDMRESMGQLVGIIGVAPDSAAKVMRLFKTMGASTDKMAGDLAVTVAALSKAAGVAPTKVFDDMAASSKEIHTYFKGNYKQAMLAAVELRRMGSSLKEAANTAKGLLDFETNITAELEASVLMGKQLDLSRARYLAFTGDIAGSQKEILKQVGDLNHFNKLNVIQKEALAKAAGMEVDQLANMLEQKDRLAKLTAGERREYKNLIESVKREAEINRGNLLVDTQRQIAQDKMKAGWSDIIMKLSSVLFPIFNKMYDMIDKMANRMQEWLSDGRVKKTLNDVGGILKWIVVAAFDIVAFFTKWGVTGVVVLAGLILMGKVLGGAILGAIGKIFKLMRGVKGGFLDKILPGGKKIKEAGKSTKGLSTIGKSITSFLKGFRNVKTGDLIKFAATLLILSGGLYVFSQALKGFADVEWATVGKGLASLVVLAGTATLLGKAKGAIIKGAFAIAIIGAALIPLAFALNLMKDVGWETLAIAGVALVVFAGAAAILGIPAVAGFVLIGAAVLLVLGAALYVFGKALQTFIPFVKPFAEAMSIMINAVGDQVVKIINSVADSIGRLGDIDALNLLGVAAGITAVGFSLAAFGGGSVMAGIGSFIGNFLGGDPIEKMERLAKIGPGLNVAAESIKLLGHSLNNLKVPNIVEMAKLSEIAEASLRVQTNKQTNVNVAAPDNTVLLKKLDEMVDAIASMKLYMDSREVGGVLSENAPHPGLV